MPDVCCTCTTGVRKSNTFVPSRNIGKLSRLRLTFEDVETFVRSSRNAFTTPIPLSSLCSSCSHRQEYRNFESCFSNNPAWLQFSVSTRLYLITFATYTFLRRGMEPPAVCTENRETSIGDVCVYIYIL